MDERKAVHRQRAFRFVATVEKPAAVLIGAKVIVARQHHVFTQKRRVCSTRYDQTAGGVVWIFERIGIGLIGSQKVVVAGVCAARAGHFTHIIIAGQSRVGKSQHTHVLLCRIRLLLAQALAELHGAVRARVKRV